MSVSVDPRILVSDLDDIARQLNLDSKSRLAACTQTLREVIGLFDATGRLNSETSVRLLAMATQDGRLMADAFPGVSPAMPRLLDRFLEACEGMSVEVPASGPDSARNTLLELWLYRRLDEHGYRPQFIDELVPKNTRQADLLIEVGGRRLAIEAKRIRVLEALQSRVEKAMSQIVATCSIGMADAGVLFLDLSFASMQHAQHGLWRVPAPQSKADVQRQVRVQQAELLAQVFRVVEHHQQSQRVIGATSFLMPTLLLEYAHAINFVRSFVSHSYGRQSGLEEAYVSVANRCFDTRHAQSKSP
jgi:hypothetical protein